MPGYTASQRGKARLRAGAGSVQSHVLLLRRMWTTTVVPAAKFAGPGSDRAG